MRKIIYSDITKFVAVIIFIISIICGAVVTTNGVMEYFDEEEEIYSFENDFSESWYVKSLLGTPESLLYSTYYDVIHGVDDNGNKLVQGNLNSEEARQYFETRIDEIFGNPKNFEKIDYYVQLNERVFTNCAAKNVEELAQGNYYYYLKRAGTGEIDYETDVEMSPSGTVLEEIENIDDSSTIIVGCRLKEEVANKYKAIWEKQEGIAIGIFIPLIMCTLIALFTFIYLICVCGKNAEGTYENMWVDNVWLEGHLAAMAGFTIGGVALFMLVIEQYAYGDFPRKFAPLIFGVISGVVSLVLISSLLSIIRNIKTRRLTQTSVILIILKWFVRLIKKIVKWIWHLHKAFWGAIFGMLSKKAGLILGTMFFGYTAIISLFSVFTIASSSAIWVLLGVALFGLAFVVISRRSKDLDEIKKGVHEVRNGNVSYKIPEVKCDDLKTLATNINDIAIGLDESVSAQVKAERMKTELITNVSHDLKTPITSIISYTELLSKIEDLPEEARDYVAVIAKKSDRLNRLTQDLFDISKVQSGNEDVVLEKLDASLLINQALAEYENEIQASGLPFCVEAPKGLYFSADGRKMSRVYGNLISNILKYAMKNTRVFINATERDGMIEVVFKNISAYPLTFNVEEITQRFVRGDESRTADGNGLGLAIAKSYTEICNGAFEIVVDGDMFKAILRFRKYA